jgi:hypothetical protein
MTEAHEEDCVSTAEPGQVYYFAAQVTVNSRTSITFALSQLNEDQGEYRVKALKLSTSNQNSEPPFDERPGEQSHVHPDAVSDESWLHAVTFS